MKKFISLLISATMLASVLPLASVSAQSNFTTSNGSVIIEAENTNWTEAKVTNLYKGFEDGSSSDASGGKYIRPHTYAATSSDPSSLMNFTVTANEAGRYNLWVRAKSNANGGSAYHFKYTGTDWARQELSSKDDGSYTWVKIVGAYPMAANQSIKFDFAPKNAENNIDCFIFTDKATFVPSGKVSSVSVPSAIENIYGNPTITPISTHPRVMFNGNDLTRIRNNYDNTENRSNEREIASARLNYEALLTLDFSGTVSGDATSTTWNNTIEYQIEAAAFKYAKDGDATYGNKAIAELINYLNTVTFNPNEANITRKMGATIFHAAEAYDWCYDLMSASQRNTIISQCEAIAAGLECGYPPSGLGNVTGHGSETNILRDLLAFGIAVYNERPDIYNYVMGRIQQEMVPARNDYYRSNSLHQGTSYGLYRFNWDLYAYQLTLAATNGEAKLFSDDIKEVCYYYVYSRRGDGRLFIQGDDSATNWGSYNGYNFRAIKMAADIFRDPYLKDEYYRMRGNESFNSDQCKTYHSFNAVRSLIMGTPDIAFTNNKVSSLPKSRYFGSPNGTIIARTNWNCAAVDNSEHSISAVDATSSNSVVALMKIGERYGSNHEHLDAGSFQLYYKGILTGDSGIYDDYATSHDANYSKRTVAHNTLTIYDSSERFNLLGISAVNDGGQTYVGEVTTFGAWNTALYNRTSVIDHEIAGDNSYSYIKGNLKNAYSSNKAEKVLRNMAFLPTSNEDHPGIMVVYDKVTSKTASQTKKFLLHTPTEPTISGNTTTVVNDKSIDFSGNTNTYGGKLTVNTLLPEDASITKIGGDGHQFEVNGTNYAPDSTVYDYDEAGWGRIEVKAASEGTTTQFLNVLTVSDADNADEITSELIETEGLVGAKVLNKVVMFADDIARADGEFEFSVPGDASENLEFTICGLTEGRWGVACGSDIVALPSASADGGVITFEGKPGDYVLANVNIDEFIEPVLDLSGSATDISGLPADAVSTINSGNFTLVFKPNTITQTDSKKAVSLLGDAKSEFAIYRLRDTNDVYVKLPGTLSILTRAYLPVSTVNGAMNIITYDANTKTLKWYVNGKLKTSKVYPKATFSLKSIPVLGDGVAFDNIKLYDEMFTADEVQTYYNNNK